MDADRRLSETKSGFGAGAIAAFAVVALVIALALGHDEKMERAPEAAE